MQQDFNHPDRRTFLKTVSIAGAGVALSQAVLAEPLEQPVPKRKLGRPDEIISSLGIGGYSLALAPTVEESTRIAHEAIDLASRTLACVSVLAGGTRPLLRHGHRHAPGLGDRPQRDVHGGSAGRGAVADRAGLGAHPTSAPGHPGRPSPPGSACQTPVHLDPTTQPVHPNRNHPYRERTTRCRPQPQLQPQP